MGSDERLSIYHDYGRTWGNLRGTHYAGNKMTSSRKSGRKEIDLDTWHWPYQRINLGGSKEYAYPHGIGHGGIHGCDGCCNHLSFKRRLKRRKNER